MARGQGLISWNMTHGVNNSNVHIIIHNMCTMRHNASLFFLQICRNIVWPLLFILNDSYFANTNTKEGWKGKFGLLSGVYIPLLWKPRYQPHKYRSDVFFSSRTWHFEQLKHTKRWWSQKFILTNRRSTWFGLNNFGPKRLWWKVEFNTCKHKHNQRQW